MTYYMTDTLSDLAIWEKCKATTLIGAKREATAKYGGGFAHVLVIAEGDDVTSPRREIVRKLNAVGAKWLTVPDERAWRSP